MNHEYLITSNRDRFLGVQLILSEHKIPHRIQIRSYSADKAGATLYRIFVEPKTLSVISKYIS